MASGRNHDRATALWSLPWGLVVALVLGWQAGLIAAASFLIGGLWLSPDLDTRSLALRRWGALQWLWWPYRTLLPHRSFWSHGPVIGTLLRLLTLRGGIARIGRRFGLTARLVAMEKAEACIDADKPDDVVLIERIVAARG